MAVFYDGKSGWNRCQVISDLSQQNIILHIKHKKHECHGISAAGFAKRHGTKQSQQSGDVHILRSWWRHFLGQRTHLLEVAVLLDLLSFHRLLLLGENVLLAHADLKTLLEPTALAEATVRQVHLALFIVRALEIALTHHTNGQRLQLNQLSGTSFRTQFVHLIHLTHSSDTLKMHLFQAAFNSPSDKLHCLQFT